MGAEDFIPADADLPTLREAVQGCRGCDLYREATRAVFGEGPPQARWMLVGEVPGDKEDLAGHVFVGPAGRMLDKCLHEVGLDRKDGYLTNVVKHFKYRTKATKTGKRRMHDKPDAGEIRACLPWLEQEIARVGPRVLVCLGATAAKALLGSGFRVTKQRGEPVPSDLAPHVLATVHPSSLLRAPTSEARREAREAFVRDLARIPELLGS